MPEQRTIHSNHLGQILATVLLGLEDGLAVISQPSVLLNSNVLAGIISGFTSIWLTPPTAAPVPTPAPAAPVPTPAPGPVAVPNPPAAA